jgi:hypothetical protein
VKHGGYTALRRPAELKRQLRKHVTLSEPSYFNARDAYAQKVLKGNFTLFKS